MIELQISHARRQARSKRADLAWKELANAAEWERPDAPSGRLCVNQGLVAWELGNAADAEARLRRGVELAGGGVVGWFCASVEHAQMKGGAASGAVLREELVRAQKAVAPAKEEILSAALAISDGEITGSEEGHCSAGLPNPRLAVAGSQPCPVCRRDSPGLRDVAIGWCL
jgi:hypothetical protein